MKLAVYSLCDGRKKLNDNMLSMPKMPPFNVTAIIHMHCIYRLHSIMSDLMWYPSTARVTISQSHDFLNKRNTRKHTERIQCHPGRFVNLSFLGFVSSITIENLGKDRQYQPRGIKRKNVLGQQKANSCYYPDDMLKYLCALLYRGLNCTPLNAKMKK